MDRTPFKLWKNALVGMFPRVAVLGAGPSMNAYDSLYFMKNFEFVIACNWVYQNYNAHLAITTHYTVVNYFLQVDQPVELIYSKTCSDAMYRDENPHAPGVVFDVDRDLLVASSIAVTAAHLAGLIGNEVHLFGVDLKKNGSAHYYKGYHQAKIGLFPNMENFPHWCNRVRWSLEGLENFLGKKFIHH